MPLETKSADFSVPLAKGHDEHGRKEGDLGASLEETLLPFSAEPSIFFDRFLPILDRFFLDW